MSAVTIVYIVTAVISIVTALVLVNFARLSSQTRIKADEKRMRESRLTLDVASDETFKRTIYEEIHDIVDSEQSCQVISKKVSDILSKELENRLELNEQELKKQFETVIQEKSQNEEVAWKKYSKVLAEKKETEAVIHSIAEGLVVVDKDGNVVMMNQAAEKLLGISKEDKVGRPVLENMRQEQLVSLVKGSSDEEDKEIELISQDSETKKVLRASSAVIEDENGQTVGMVSVLSDITKQKELDALKSAFVANVSHELRTPLVGIEKSVTLILSKAAGELSDNQEQLLSIAQRNLKRLTLLINDLLDLSKLEAGKMELKPQYSSIEKVISDSVDNLTSWTAAKSIKIEKEIQRNLPDVYIDPNRVMQVLINLVGNSIKYTPNGGTITISAISKDDLIEVSVTDTGIGIAKESIPKIFDKFYQVSERTPSDISGTGIGLSIAKEIVGSHGGRIWVESERGAGATFTFTLPLKTVSI